MKFTVENLDIKKILSKINKDVSKLELPFCGLDTGYYINKVKYSSCKYDKLCSYYYNLLLKKPIKSKRINPKKFGLYGSYRKTKKGIVLKSHYWTDIDYKRIINCNTNKYYKFGPKLFYQDMPTDEEIYKMLRKIGYYTEEELMMEAL